ncbi:MAG: TIM barrel protein [Alphaproteobacteria bacterium]|nr:TIM barrel protein [Alphaproteobacteria bacterium]
MVATTGNERHLRTMKQIGVDHVVHYAMDDLPEAADDLKAIRDRYREFDLAWAIAESGPAIDRIVLGKKGWQAQTERYKRILRILGDLGVGVIAYNFMPQVSEDAMVIRTDLDARARGGAKTSRFALADIGPRTMPHDEQAIPREAMWRNLERFLEAVLPVAESAGVKMAMHPDDPPMSPLCGLERIMDRVESFERLLALSSSPSNAVTFCAGCFGELGVDVVALFERFIDRVPYVHVRNIEGIPADFIETFPDEGRIDLPGLVGAFERRGFGGFVRPDHAPLLATDGDEMPAGYGIQGHIFTIGYLRGVQQAIARRA